MAGSFQVIRDIEPNRFDEVVPMYPGVRFLLVMEGNGCGAWSFVRTANKCHQLTREEIVDEDWEGILEVYESRLNLI